MIVARNGSERLFTKNTGSCEFERRSIGADTCPVRIDETRGSRSPVEVFVNDGPNLEDPKVAKFLGH